MRNTLALVAFLVTVSTLAGAPEADAGNAPRIKLSSTTVQSGEKLNVDVSGLPGHARDWLTLVGADLPESTYGDWKWTNGNVEGSWTFVAPATPGNYEIRVYYGEPAGDYTVDARAAVKVTAPSAAQGPEASAGSRSGLTLALSATSVTTGSEVEIRVSGLPGNPYDWITLVQADAKPGASEEFVYTNGVREGRFTLRAPDEPGEYELDFSKLSIQFIPNLSLSIPNLEPQNVSFSGIVTLPSLENPSKTFCCSSAEEKLMHKWILSPTEAFCSGDVSAAINVNFPAVSEPCKTLSLKSSETFSAIGEPS